MFRFSQMTVTSRVTNQKLEINNDVIHTHSISQTFVLLSFV